MASFSWPSPGEGVSVYPTFASFPATATNGALALALDTRILYEYSTTAVNWTAIASPTSALAISALTGDVTATGPGSVVATLATVNSNVGSFGTASATGTFTVNGKGLVTAASSTAIQIAESQVTNLASDLAAKVATASLGNLTDAGTDGIAITGGTGAVVGSVSIAQQVSDTTHNGYLSSTDWNTFNGKQGSGNYITALTGDGTASGPGSVALTFATVNSNVGSFGGAATTGTFTVNGKGLITAASSTSIQIAESQVTSLVSDLALKAPLASPTFTGTVVIPTPFTLGATSVTSTGTQLNYLNAATGTTGTTSTNLVYSTSPSLVTPVLGAASATSLAMNNTSAQFLVGTGSSATAKVIVSGTDALITGTTARAFAALLTTNSNNTAGVQGYFANLTTAASTTVTNVSNFISSSLTVGSGGTVTRFLGFLDTTAAGHPGTNNASFADNTAFTGNYFINQNGTDSSVLSGQLLPQYSSAAQAIFSGYQSVSSVSNTNNGEIRLGTNASDQARFAYDGQTTGQLYIDNTFDNATGNILFRTRTLGTPVVTTLSGSGNWTMPGTLNLGSTTTSVGGAWTSWSPTVTAGSGTITTVGTVVARYQQLGKIVYFSVTIPITTNGSGAGFLQFTLPVATASISANQTFTGQQTDDSFAVTAVGLNNSTSCRIYKYDGTYPTASGKTITVSGVYESA